MHTYKQGNNNQQHWVLNKRP